MDTARYILALVAVISFPPALLFWFLVHPFISFWRGVGVGWTYAIVGPSIVLAGVGLYQIKDFLLGADLGFSIPLLILGLVLYGISAVIEIRCRKLLKLPVLVGIPELKAPAAGGGTLLREGIYGRIRHPRYVSATFGFAAVALFTNYSGVYLMLPVIVVGVYLVTIFEERELRQRFGAEYDTYRSEVPAFIPRR
jgi:protein-S-isoprenylcysteine O-methyltransferase Ste14